jgi:hypothetical protein
MSVLPQQQYSGLKATCQIAFSPPASNPPYLIHYQSLTEYPKVRRFHHYHFVFTWTIFPPYLVTPTLNRTLMTRKFSSPSILRQIDAAITNLEQDLHRVASWCCENHLLINLGKTKYMMIGKRQLMSKLPTGTSVSFLGKSLKPVDSAKDLGVTLDRYLNYDKHVSLLVSSCRNKLCQVNRAKNSFDSKTLSEVISSL